MVRPIQRRIEDGIEIWEEPSVPGLVLAMALFPLMLGFIIGLAIVALTTS